MPKVVDHARRRTEIVEATWRLIAQRGLEGTTMREIAAALGVANGALTRYFPGKDELVQAAFEHVVAATEERVDARLGDRRGLAAVRVFCEELLPRAEGTQLEARVVLPFWSRALTDPDLAASFDRSMNRWRERLAGFLVQARADGELGSDEPDDVLVEQLLAVLTGARALTVLSHAPPGSDLPRQTLEAHLRGLSRAATPPAAGGRSAAAAPDPPDPPDRAHEDPAPAEDRGLDFLTFAQAAVDTTVDRLPETDPRAMQLILLLYRLTNAVVYDIESTVHRPAGWSWSAFRLTFTLWVAGPLESRQAAVLSGMSRAAVSSLTNTLTGSGVLERSPDPRDGRGVLLSLTARGRGALESTFRVHNEREAQWASLLTREELDTLNAVLGRLATAAGSQEWVNRR